jgi:hypothetical protein
MVWGQSLIGDPILRHDKSRDMSRLAKIGSNVQVRTIATVTGGGAGRSKSFRLVKHCCGLRTLDCR